MAGPGTKPVIVVSRQLVFLTPGEDSLASKLRRLHDLIKRDRACAGEAMASVDHDPTSRPPPQAAPTAGNPPTGAPLQLEILSDTLDIDVEPSDIEDEDEDESRGGDGDSEAGSASCCWQPQREEGPFEGPRIPTDEELLDALVDRAARESSPGQCVGSDQQPAGKTAKDATAGGGKAESDADEACTLGSAVVSAGAYGLEPGGEKPPQPDAQPGGEAVLPSGLDSGCGGPVVTRYTNLSLTQRDFLRKGVHVLATFSLEPTRDYSYLEVAAHFAACSSTGDVRGEGRGMPEDALVYGIHTGKSEVKIAYPILLFTAEQPGCRDALARVMHIMVDTYGYAMLTGIFFPDTAWTDEQGNGLAEVWRQMGGRKVLQERRQKRQANERALQAWARVAQQGPSDGSRRAQERAGYPQEEDNISKLTMKIDKFSALQELQAERAALDRKQAENDSVSAQERASHARLEDGTSKLTLKNDKSSAEHAGSEQAENDSMRAQERASHARLENGTSKPTPRRLQAMAGHLGPAAAAVRLLPLGARATRAELRLHDEVSAAFERHGTHARCPSGHTLKVSSYAGPKVCMGCSGRIRGACLTCEDGHFRACGRCALRAAE